jgi:hypothetical protein
MRLLQALALSLIAASFAMPRAEALDKVHAGTAVALWAFLPLQVGQEQGIWQK